MMHTNPTKNDARYVLRQLADAIDAARARGELPCQIRMHPAVQALIGRNFAAVHPAGDTRRVWVTWQGVPVTTAPDLAAAAALDVIT